MSEPVDDLESAVTAEHDMVPPTSLLPPFRGPAGAVQTPRCSPDPGLKRANSVAPTGRREYRELVGPGAEAPLSPPQG
jgi:hypothetical protein